MVVKAPLLVSLLLPIGFALAGCEALTLSARQKVVKAATKAVCDTRSVKGMLPFMTETSRPMLEVAASRGELGSFLAGWENLNDRIAVECAGTGPTFLPEVKVTDTRYIVRTRAAGTEEIRETIVVRDGDSWKIAMKGDDLTPRITVAIGHAGPLTGPISHLGKDDENGVALAIQHANDRKLVIDGKLVTFRMLSEDDQADPKVGTTVAQKLVDAKVVAVIGHTTSGVSIPASEVYARASIPMISGSSTNPTLTERGMKTVLRTVGRDDQQGPAIAAYIASELKAKRVAVIDDKTAYGEGLAAEVEKTLKAAEVDVVARERTTDKETDFKAILTKVKARNPDVIFYGGMDATAAPMMKQARELGIKATFAFGDGVCTDEVTRLAGTAAEGLACAQAGLPASAASREFQAAFQAKFGEIKQYAPYFYDATIAVVEAIQKSGSVEPAKFAPEIFNVAFQGATGKVAFDAKGDRKDAEITIFRMKDGRVVPQAVVKGGVSTPFAVPASATAPPPPEPAKK